MSDDDTEWFRERLARSDRWKGFPWLLIPEKEVVFTLPGAAVEIVTMSEEFLKATDKVSFVCSKLAVSDDQIAAVERVTIG